jgi:hypothetical protein
MEHPPGAPLAAERLAELQQELARLLERWALRIADESDRGRDRAALAIDRCHDELADLLARSRG